MKRLSIQEKRPFVPNPEQLALVPETSGNTINGLGEREIRRPTPIYWHDPDILVHGALQKWSRTQGNSPKVTALREGAMRVMQTPLPPIAPMRAELTPRAWSDAVKMAALDREADIVGIARLDPNWIFEGYEETYQWIIVLGMRMDYQALSTAPSGTSRMEVHTQYARGARAAYALACWVREQGWDAKPHGGSTAGSVLLIPAAIAAGLGELGKHGSMINRRFGSMFRLACVMTDMPLLADRPDTFGADDFCVNCRVCTRACPVDAIHEEKQMGRGSRKWFVDFDKCVLYFNENSGCGICIAQCPWSRPGVAPRLVEKYARRK